MIIGRSKSGKTNVLLNLYLYVKGPFESKYQLLINGREKVGIKHEKNPNAFIDYSKTVDDVYEDLEDYNTTRTKVFDNMIADMERRRKLNISLAFI